MRADINADLKLRCPPPTGRRKRLVARPGLRHPDDKHYTRLEDAQGLLIACAQAALGIHLLRAAGLMTGGTAGLALLLTYIAQDHGIHLTFGGIFFAINIPFYAFAYKARGIGFCLKSLASVTLVSLMAEALKPFLHVDQIHPAVAALLFGVSAGVGLLGLFRHSGSLGGVSIVALVLQDRFGFKAGWTQTIHDLGLFLIAFWVLPLGNVGWSLLGAVILNAVIAFNHRRDWYVVT
ncbi:YitT family protein [Thioclava sp. GXIMD4215]|uniref:YitT family protein n=1 Tax=Thioclava sp. GXIMD4215 TaxID=3131928 RepID=UPI0032562F38